MAAIVIIDGGCGLGVEVRCRNQPNKRKLSLYKLLLSLNIPFKQLYIHNYVSNKTEHFSYKGEYGMNGLMPIEASKIRAGLGYR